MQNQPPLKVVLPITLAVLTIVGVMLWRVAGSDPQAALGLGGIAGGLLLFFGYMVAVERLARGNVAAGIVVSLVWLVVYGTGVTIALMYLDRGSSGLDAGQTTTIVTVQTGPLSSSTSRTTESSAESHRKAGMFTIVLSVVVGLAFAAYPIVAGFQPRPKA